MAITAYSLAGVPLDYCQFDWPMYRGARSLPVTLVQSLGRLNLLDAACKSAKGVVDLTVQCSAKPGTAAPSKKTVVKGMRVLDVYKRGDATCAVVLADAREDIKNWICKKDLNLLYRDGYLDGTRKALVTEAIPFLLEDVWGKFAGDALRQVLETFNVPDDLVYAGASLGKTIDDLLGRLGLDIWCGIDGKLRIAARADIGANPIKGTYSWFIGKEPGWLTTSRTRFRRPKKLRYYYLRKHAIMARITHDRTSDPPSYLTVVFEQRYSDGDQFFTLEQLLQKYAPAAVGSIDDSVLARVYMSENFEGTPIERNGSANRDALIRIIKNDWRKLYEVRFADGRVGIGGFDDMRVGIYKRIVTPTAKQAALGLKAGDITGDVQPAGAIRGEWVEFMNVISGSPPAPGGAVSIIGQSSVTNHLKSGAVLPAAPFTATWENEEAGIIRIKQEKLPDNNFAVVAKCTNEAEMRVNYQPIRTVVTKTGAAVATRWGIDAPARSKAELAVTDAVALLVGTQRLPNSASRWHMVEIDAYPDGDIDVQEFEVSDKPALFDYVDLGGITDGQAHDAGPDGMGRPLNEQAIKDDADTRAASFMDEMDRRFEGPGVAAGTDALEKEEIAGSVSKITLKISDTVVGTQIECSNLATDESRQQRAKRRAHARKASAGGKVLEAVA